MFLIVVISVQIGSRSSVYSPESSVRKTGSYIYEEFMPTDGTDVKVLYWVPSRNLLKCLIKGNMFSIFKDIGLLFHKYGC